MFTIGYKIKLRQATDLSLHCLGSSSHTLEKLCQQCGSDPEQLWKDWLLHHRDLPPASEKGQKKEGKMKYISKEQPMVNLLHSRKVVPIQVISIFLYLKTCEPFWVGIFTLNFSYTERLKPDLSSSCKKCLWNTVQPYTTELYRTTVGVFYKKIN